MASAAIDLIISWKKRFEENNWLFSFYTDLKWWIDTFGKWYILSPLAWWRTFSLKIPKMSSSFVDAGVHDSWVSPSPVQNSAKHFVQKYVGMPLRARCYLEWMNEWISYLSTQIQYRKKSKEQNCVDWTERLKEHLQLPLKIRKWKKTHCTKTKH